MKALLDAVTVFLRRFGFPTFAAVLLGLLLWKQMELNAAQSDTMKQHDEMQATWFVLLEKYQAATAAVVVGPSPCDKEGR